MGVHTCALPIPWPAVPPSVIAAWRTSLFPPTCKNRNCRESRPPNAIRSEERRVGKECRSRCDGSAHLCSSDPLACRPAIGYRGVPHITFPTDLQEQELSRKQASKRNQIGRASCRERV